MEQVSLLPAISCLMQAADVDTGIALKSSTHANRSIRQMNVIACSMNTETD